MNTPKFQDRVRHKTSANNNVGIVISEYPGPRGKTYLDVRDDDDTIHWETPAENWEVIEAYKEGE